MNRNQTLVGMIIIAKSMGKAKKHHLGKAIFLGRAQGVKTGINIQIRCRDCGRRAVIKIGGTALDARCDNALVGRKGVAGPGRPRDSEALARRLADAERRARKHEEQGHMKLAARVWKKVFSLRAAAALGHEEEAGRECVKLLEDWPDVPVDADGDVVRRKMEEAIAAATVQAPQTPITDEEARESSTLLLRARARMANVLRSSHIAAPV